MSITVPTWLMWMIVGYTAGRLIEAIGKFVYHMHKETQN